jgi:hypothetical protein
MKNKLCLSGSILMVLVLASCTVATPEPTPMPTFTPSPTDTPLPTDTPTPTVTKTVPPPSPTEDIFSAMVPVGVPETEWKGIPVMPGAIAGEGDNAGYTFTIQATVEEIQSYYEKELAKQNTYLLASGQGQNGSNMLIFMKDSQTVSISIFPYQDFYIVMLVK